MENSVAHLGAPAPNSNIADTLSSLADTLQLSGGATAQAAPTVAQHIPNASPVDVSGMLQSLSAAVPALGGASAAPSNNPSTHSLSADARGPSGGLSGLGSQLLQLQQHMKDSQSSEANASASKHRSTAAAIAAALHDATPQDDDAAPAAPDFTLLSETVSESLHHHSHTRDPPERKTPRAPPAPAPTPPVSHPAVPAAMKARPPGASAPLPPPGPHINHAQMQAQPPAPPRPRPQPSPAGGLPPARSDAAMPSAAPPGPPGAAFVHGPRSRPAAGHLMPHINGTPRRPAAADQDAAPRPMKPSAWTAPQPPRPAGPQQHSRPPQPHPSRPGQQPRDRPAAQRPATAARDQSGPAPASSRPGSLMAGGQRPAATERPSAPNGGNKAAASQQARSVVHPNNPLKRIPVSAAQAIKPAQKVSQASSAAQGPSAMLRLAAAKANLDRKKVPPSAQQQAATAKPNVKREDPRVMARGSLGNGAKSEPASASVPTEKSATESRPTVQRGSDSNGGVAQLGQMRAKLAERPASVRAGEKRAHQPTAIDASERQAMKKIRHADSVHDVRARPGVERAKGSAGTWADGSLRQTVRPSSQHTRPSPHPGKHGSKATGGVESDVSAERVRDRIAARMPQTAKPWAPLGLGSMPRAAARRPAPRAPVQAMDDSSDDDMVLMQRAPGRQAAPPARTREASEDARKQGAAVAAGGKMRRGAVSPPGPRAVSTSPQRRQPEPVAQLRMMMPDEVSHRPGKRPKVERRAHASREAAAPAAMAAPQDLAEHVPLGGGRGAAASGIQEDAPRGHVAPGSGGVRPAVVTHDVEAQTEPPDVRDSSVQTAQLWGRSTACQASLPASEPARPQCHMKSMSVQCDIAVAAGSLHGGGKQEEEEEADVIRKVTEALCAAHALLSDRQSVTFGVHEAAILDILGTLPRHGVADVQDMGEEGEEAWDAPADDGAELAEPEVSVHGSDGVSNGAAEMDWHEEGWRDGGPYPHAEDDNMQAAPSSVSAGVSELGAGLGGHSNPGTPRLAEQHFEDAACSPDEVQLNVAPSREESPDEVPVAALHMEAGGGEESDDEVPLEQSAPAGSEQFVQEDEEPPDDGGEGVQVDEASNGSLGDGVEDEDVAVLQAAIMSRLRKLLPKADLNVATAKSVRGRLEFSLRRDLKSQMAFIKDAISAFLEDPAAFAVEPAEEAALAARLVPPAQHRNGAADRGAGPAAAQPHSGARATGPREGGPREEHPAAARLREGAATGEKRSSPAPDLVGRLNGAIAPKRKGGGALYCTTNKSAKERFQTSMTPEQLREAKEAARAGLD